MPKHVVIRTRELACGAGRWNECLNDAALRQCRSLWSTTVLHADVQPTWTLCAFATVGTVCFMTSGGDCTWHESRQRFLNIHGSAEFDSTTSDLFCRPRRPTYTFVF